MKINKIIALPLAFLLLVFSTIGVSAENTDAAEIKYASTANYFLNLFSTQEPTFGSEWVILGLARGNMISDELADTYCKNIEAYVGSNASPRLSRNTSTDNSRVVLALSSVGRDVTNVAGFNLLEPLADFNFVKKQGLSGPVWALIAFDCCNYEIPNADSAAEQTTRGGLIDYILSSQLDDGGWDIASRSADPDMTAMALTALSRHNYRADVSEACRRGADALSRMQGDDGGYSSWGAGNAESCAQALTAICAMGSDPRGDERFIKNGNDPLDALLGYSVENGFEHIRGGGFNQMATEQGMYALAAYLRNSADMTSLFDMSDIKNTVTARDLNGDGVVDISDATMLQKHICLLSTISDELLCNADVNHDGTINITDVTVYQKAIAGVEY